MAASVIEEPDLEQGAVNRDFASVRCSAREMVFDAWAEPKQIAYWAELRGVSGPNHRTFTEMVRPDLIAYRDCGNRESGRKNEEREAVVTFEAFARGKTRLTMTSVFGSSGVRDRAEDGAVESGTQTLAQLVEYLHKELRGEQREGI